MITQRWRIVPFLHVYAFYIYIENQCNDDGMKLAWLVFSGLQVTFAPKLSHGLPEGG